MPRKRSEAARRRAKKWYPVIAKQVFKSTEIGEIPCKSIETLLNRKLTVSLMTLTRDFKHQDAHVTFQITSISGQTAEADAFGYKLSPATIKRIVKRRSNRIDVRVVDATKEGKKIVIKLVITTLNNTYAAVQKKIRAKAEEMLKSQLSSNPFITIFESIIHNKLQRELRKALNKIYPVRTVVVREFRFFEPDALTSKQGRSSFVKSKEEVVESKPKPAESKS